MRDVVAVFALVLTLVPQAYAKSLSEKPKECVNWAKVYARESLPRSQDGIFVKMETFRNETKNAGDDWLSLGIGDLLIRYLETNSDLHLLTEQTANATSFKAPKTFQIGGLFQHTENQLRIFVHLKDPQGETLAEIPIQIPYPLHKQFFTGLMEAAQILKGKIGLRQEKGDIQALIAIENETSKVLAFENYIKGMGSLQTFDPNRMEVALIWFQEALREDKGYIKAYQGIMEVHGFLSLHRKVQGEPYNATLEKIQETLKTMKKNVASPPSRTKKNGGLENRYLESHVRYIAGLRAFEKGDNAKAAKELKEALSFLPLDPLSAYTLGLAYDRLKDPGEGERYKRKAREMNGCLK